MAKLNYNDTLQILDRMSKLDPVYRNRELRAPNDPILQGFAFGNQIRENYLAEREAKKNQQREREYKDQFFKKHNSGSNNDGTLNGFYSGQPQGVVYASGSPDGVYIKGSRIDNPTQNGVYVQGRQNGYFPNNTSNITNMGNLYNGSEAMQEVAQNQIANNNPNKYTFNERDYLPSKSNGYHINDNPRMAEWGSSQDWQRQQVRNAMRDVYEGTDWYRLPYNNFGSAIANAEQPQKAVDRYPQELAGLTGEDLQRAGQAYNQNIDSGYSGFGRALQNAENAVAPQVAPTVQPTTQYIPTTTPPTSSPSVADFKQYENGQNYNTTSVADFKRNEGGYNTPMVEVPDPSVEYPYATQGLGDQQKSANAKTNGVYNNLNWLERKRQEELENRPPVYVQNPEGGHGIRIGGKDIGLRYVKDPNNPSVLDGVMDYLGFSKKP